MSPIVAQPARVSQPGFSSPGEDEMALLLSFVRERDVHCPRCDYNLRNLTQPVCPECHEALQLTVGARRPQFGWLISALAPGIFSGIAAFFLAGMLIIVNFSPRGSAPWQPYVMDAFGWFSGCFALILFRRRYRYIRMLPAAQAGIAVGIWFVHVFFFVFMMFMLMR